MQFFVVEVGGDDLGGGEGAGKLNRLRAQAGAVIEDAPRRGDGTGGDKLGKATDGFGGGGVLRGEHAGLNDLFESVGPALRGDEEAGLLAVGGEMGGSGHVQRVAVGATA